MVVLVQSETEFIYTNVRETMPGHQTVLLKNRRMKAESAKHETLFPYKLPNNFKGCLINLFVPYHETFEVKYFFEFLKGLHFTVKTDAKHWENDPNTDVIHNAMEDVLFGVAEIAFGVIPLLKEASDVADSSLSYYQTLYMRYIPCAKPLLHLHAMSHVPSISRSAILITFMFLTFMFITWCMAHMTLESHMYKTASSVFYT
jgi:hypothetical protein